MLITVMMWLWLWKWLWLRLWLWVWLRVEITLGVIVHAGATSSGKAGSAATHGVAAASAQPAREA